MIAVTVPQPAPDKGGNLRRRLISAAVLGPLALAILYYGSPFVEGLLILTAALAAWEWARLCGSGSVIPKDYLTIGGAALCVLVAALGYYDIALWLVVPLLLMSAVLAWRDPRGSALWSGLGVIYVALPMLAFLWLRLVPEEGRALIFWLLFVVWATDTGAFVFGRSLGGPKLAPRVSPNKTWSGLLGGVVIAAAIGWIAAKVFMLSAPAGLLAVAGAGLAIVAQVGDLFESGVKRKFKVKDSSHLIPGHGGVLDRIDGLMTTVLLMAAVVLWSGIGSQG